MHDPAMTNTTALTKGTSYLRKYVLKATEHSGRFVLNDSARTRPSSWRRCDDVLDYIWRQEILLQDKTSKIEELQQLLHSERQRMELLIPIAVLVCVFLLNFLTALRDWLLPRIHGEVQGVPVRAIRGVAVATARQLRVPVVVDAETVDNLTACLLRRRTERKRERFLGGQWSTDHNASNIVCRRDMCESCGSGQLQLSQLAY